jgi:tetratricopeptide (TPR) repeat protein
MNVITITQRNSLDRRFEAILTIDGSKFAIEVCDPFAGDGRERALEWYFEEWIRFPFTDTVAATSAAGSVKDYGVALFDQVFRGNRQAFAAYRGVAGNLSEVEFVIQGDPGFQALHWEAMWDGDMPRPLAVDAVMVRQRRVRNGIAKVQRQDSSTVLNLLVVTARPDEENDVGYRTISRPLVEAIETAKLPVNVEFVRPGTYGAFVRQLEAKGEGFYHLVHFDMHGGLMSFEQFHQAQRFSFWEAMPTAENQVFQRGYSLPNLERYDGVQAFLFFEGDEAGVPVTVTAQEMSDRLSMFGISACVLNACQSGKQVSSPSPLAPLPGGEGDRNLDVRETSLGARLMDAGMQMVVAMAYSVTVDAARLLVTQLYGELFGSVGLDRALQRSRSELYARKERKVYFGQKVDLEDWLLPVVYRNQAVDLRLRRMYPEEEEAYFTKQALRFQFGNQFSTTYGFVGRDLDILKVEKGLIRDGAGQSSNAIMLYGMGGTGKTTLLRYLQDWWVLTGFVEGVSYFGYDDRAWTLAQILFNVAKDVMTEVELRSFQAMPQVAQVGKLAQVLKTRRWLVVLDNLESVTGQALAIANTLTTAEQGEIRSFLGMLRGGQTRVVLGSRRREEWLSGVYGGNEYELRGLDGLARTELAQKVLERYVKDGGKRRSILADKDFARLMKLLAGYPLAIEVVLSNLGRQSVAEVLAGLDGADVSLDRAGNKTESILQCVDYSHGNLSAAAQRSLLCLAPFSGFVVRNALGNYVEQLQAAGDAFGDLTLEALDGAVGEAIAWGLLMPMSVDNPNFLTIQPVFPYFLRTKLAQEDGAFCEALRLGFKNHYEGLARYYNQMMESKEAQEKQLGVMFCKLEYENLYAALQIALERQESVDIYFCLSTYCDRTQDIQLKQSLSEGVAKKHKSYNPEIVTGEIGLEVIMVLDRLASCYLMTKQYKDARDSYQRVLDLLSTLQGVDPRQIQSAQASTYHQLGSVAQELREFEQARKDYQQALQINIEFGDRYNQASTYHQLGMVAQELREYDQARKDYQQALEIKIEFGDRYSQARTYHQLGRVAQELREYDQARKDYQQALQIKIEFGDRYSQASTYHQLGIVAQELREYDQARKDYQQALEIKIEFGDRYSQASTYHQLGRVAQELCEYDQARKDYQQALQIKVECGDRYGQAGTLHNLGAVAQELREYDQARKDYQQALQIFIEFGDRYSQASTYHQLGRVAQELREYDQARKDYQQALEIFIESGDRYSQASTYGQLGLLAQAEEQPGEAIQQLLKALEIFSEFQDNHSAAMTVRNISRVYKSPPSPQFLSQISQVLGVGDAEVLQMFESVGGG